MEKKPVFAIFIIFIGLSTSSNASGNISGYTPSKHAEFSLLTNTPGRELYTIFGHSAIRYKDSLYDVDIVYNYGTFDFSTPYFYLKFIKGKLNYFLSVQSFDHYFIWTDDTQTIYEQKLQLTLSQKKELIRFLENNYQGENRFYLYDFFFDNCATRIRDALKKTFLDDVTFEFFEPPHDRTFRQLLDPYIMKYPWVDLGIDLALGMEADKIAAPREYMFLPDYLMEAFSVASIRHDNEMMPLVNENQTLKEGTPDHFMSEYYMAPVFVFWTIFGIILVISFLGYKTNRINVWIDRITFGITGLLGLLFIFLWIGTNHAVMQNNLNIIWALPTNILLLFIINRKERFLKLLNHYYLILTIILLVFLATSRLLPQEFHFSIYPLVLIQLTRSIMNYKRYQKIQKHP